jgi:hypothetical protein
MRDEGRGKREEGRGKREDKGACCVLRAARKARGKRKSEWGRRESFRLF